MKLNYVMTYEWSPVLNALADFFNQNFDNLQKTNEVGKGNKPPKMKQVKVDGFDKNPQHYLKNIQRVLGFNEQETILFLRRIYALYPGAFINVVLRLIAVELDKRYEDHIYDTGTVWVFNTIDSKIYPVEVADIKQAAFRYFAAFRSKEEAVFGIKMANAIKHYVFEWQTEK